MATLRDIGGGTRPRDDQSPLIAPQTDFAPNDPAVIREAFTADLLRTAAFAHRMDQLDAVGVNDTQHRWSGYEGLCPVLMDPEEAQEPSTLGEVVIYSGY